MKIRTIGTRSALSASTIRKPFKFQIQREQWAFWKLKSAIYVLNPTRGVSRITVRSIFFSVDIETRRVINTLTKQFLQDQAMINEDKSNKCKKKVKMKFTVDLYKY